MRNPPIELPTYRDFCPNDPPSLDEEYAAKQFLGKSLTEAEALFRENCIHYSEDLMWMGVRAFEFYIYAFRNYLLSDASRQDDDGIISVLASAIEFRKKHDDVGNATPVIIECLDYAIANFDKLELDNTLPDPSDLDDISPPDQETLEMLARELHTDPDELKTLFETPLSEIIGPRDPDSTLHLKPLDRLKHVRKMF